MEKVFEDLQKEGKNDVESLIKWMKESKVIEDSKSSEDKVRALFNDAANKQSVELEKFKEVIGKLAAEQKKSVADFAQSLAAKVPEMQNVLAGAVSGALAGASEAMKGSKN